MNSFSEIFFSVHLAQVISLLKNLVLCGLDIQYVHFVRVNVCLQGLPWLIIRQRWYQTSASFSHMPLFASTVKLAHPSAVLSF